MADANESNAEEVVENTENQEPETPEVELDRTPDVEGELIQNPVLEEVEETDDTNTGVVEPDNADADGGDEPAKGEEAEEAAETDEPAQPTEAAEVAADEEPAQVADPGDFTPKGDYSFEITTVDGKTVKIATPEEAKAFAKRLDEEDSLLSASQFAEFNASYAEMRQSLAVEKRQYEADKQAFETQQQAEQARTEQLTNWTNELKYLEAKGSLPKIDAAKDADWLANSEDPAVKARMEIFTWMDKENQARNSAGIAPVTSAVDAYRMMQAEQAQEQANSERQQEGDARRAAGSRIKGASQHIPSTSSNMIVGEGGSLNDLVLEAQNNLYN